MFLGPFWRAEHVWFLTLLSHSHRLCYCLHCFSLPSSSVFSVHNLMKRTHPFNLSYSSQLKWKAKKAFNSSMLLWNIHFACCCSWNISLFTTLTRQITSLLQPWGHLKSINLLSLFSLKSSIMVHLYDKNHLAILNLQSIKSTCVKKTVFLLTLLLF